MINTNTTNTSFINMWRYLQDRNIENNSFMLELHDESLKNFKLEDLEIEDKTKRYTLLEKVKNECKNNIWFFFREIVRIPNPVAIGSGQPHIGQVQYILNPFEMAMIYSYDKQINFLSRVDGDVHHGIKTTVNLLEYYTYLFHRSDFPSTEGMLSIDYYPKVWERRRDNILHTNFLVFPEIDYAYDFCDKIITPENVGGKHIVDIKVGNYQNIFMSIDNTHDTENLYHTLFKLKFYSNLDTNIYGCIRGFCDNKTTDMEKMLGHFMIQVIPTVVMEDILYSNKQTIDKSRIYIIN